MTMKLLELENRRTDCPAENWAEESTALLKWKPRKSLLLISNDAGLGVSLGNAADLADLTFRQVAEPVPGFWMAALEHPAAVFLDLDLRVWMSGGRRSISCSMRAGRRWCS